MGQSNISIQIEWGVQFNTGVQFITIMCAIQWAIETKK